MSAAQADWDDQHGRMPPLTKWLDSLSAAEQAALAASYATKLARMMGPNPINQTNED